MFWLDTCSSAMWLSSSSSVSGCSRQQHANEHRAFFVMTTLIEQARRINSAVDLSAASQTAHLPFGIDGKDIVHSRLLHRSAKKKSVSPFMSERMSRICSLLHLWCCQQK